MKYRKIGNVICDPTSEEAKALVGKMVTYADTYKGLEEGYGILEEIAPERRYPFFIKGNRCGWVFVCAVEEVPEEKHYREYTEEEAIRLIGRVYRSKDGGPHLYQALGFVSVDGTDITLDGRTQPIFMNSYEWYDPKTGVTEPIGAEVEE